MSGQIQLFVDDATGEVTITVNGVKGEGCLNLTEDLENYFGDNATERQLTDEHDESPPIEAEADQHLRRG